MKGNSGLRTTLSYRQHIVDLGEDAVELFLVGAQLFKTCAGLGFACFVFVADGGCYGLSLRGGCPEGGVE